MDSEQSFRNQFLIALPSLNGDYFEGTISLLVDHNAQGAFGLVVNRPIEASIADIFPKVADHFSCPVLAGGPVDRNQMFFLHEAGREYDATFKVSDQVWLTTSTDFIESMSDGTAPSKTLALLGYAGWGESQLEDEISRNAWLLAPVLTRILFETPFEQRAQAAAAGLGIDLNLISPVAGHD